MISANIKFVVKYVVRGCTRGFIGHARTCDPVLAVSVI